AGLSPARHRPGARVRSAGKGRRPPATADHFLTGETTMWFSSFRSWLQAASKSTARSFQPGPKRPCRPRLEVLEDRLVPAAPITVTTLLDVVNPNDGVTSLREAINASNANPSDADTIVFQPGLTGAINLSTTNPSKGQLFVTGPVNILGPGSGLLM